LRKKRTEIGGRGGAVTPFPQLATRKKRNLKNTIGKKKKEKKRLKKKKDRRSS